MSSYYIFFCFSTSWIISFSCLILETSSAPPTMDWPISSNNNENLLFGPRRFLSLKNTEHLNSFLLQNSINPKMRPTARKIPQVLQYIQQERTSNKKKRDSDLSIMTHITLLREKLLKEINRRNLIESEARIAQAVADLRGSG